MGTSIRIVGLFGPSPLRRQGSIFNLLQGGNVTLKSSYVYIVASDYSGTLYIGVTSDLVKRVYEHRNDLAPGFTQRYQVHRLVWYEVHEDIREAIRREKQLKKWKRAWKIRLIEEENPYWEDLYPKIIG